MTILFSDGFESGDYTGWASTTVSGAGSTLTANAASAHAGSFGSDALVTGGGGNESTCKGTTVTTTTSVLTGQCQFRVHQNNVGGGEAYLLQLHNSGDTFGVNFENNAGTWAIVFTNRAGSLSRTSLQQQTFTIDTWYVVELLSDWSGANQVYQLYVNGTLDTTVTDSSSGSNRVYAKVLGGIYTANGMAGNFETYSDEYKVGDAYIGTTTTLSGGPTLVDVAVAGTLAETYVLTGGPTLSALSLAGTLAETYSLTGAVTVPRLAVAGALVADPPRLTARSVTAGVALATQSVPATVALGSVSKPAPVPLV